MIALGELRLAGSIECELLGLFIRYVAALDRGFCHISCSVDTYLDDHFTFLIEGVGGLRKSSFQATSFERPVMSAHRTVSDRIPFLSVPLAVAGTGSVSCIAEE